MKQTVTDANNMNLQAILILDQIKNYNKKNPRWSEMTIHQCIAWWFCSPKGYEFPRNSLFKLSCKTTLKKYFGIGNEDLIQNRLVWELKNLNAMEKVCFW
jgi:hypothetical protein